MRFYACLVCVALVSGAAPAIGQGMSMEQAVALALARNHDVIASRLELETAEFDRVQAGVYPNPVFGYGLGNLVLGRATGSPPMPQPGFFGQTVHAFSISDVVDIWGKRSARLRAANRSVAFKKLLAEDAIREIVYAVRSAFADVVREQSERDLSHETRARYDETVHLSRSRFAAGDISDAELKKVELEGLRYQNAEVDAVMELDLSRQKLAALLALGSADQLPGPLQETEAPRMDYAMGPLIDRALMQRPDVRAAKEAKLLSDAMLAQARREADPDISLGLVYTHSQFTVSGDNSNTIGVAISVPLPIFDRNQANIGRAEVDRRRADNEGQKLVLEVRYDVAGAFRRVERAKSLLDVFNGGMLTRAESALKVAENSYRAGGISLLELLEAQRTYLETRAQFLRAVYDYRQATIDMMYAVGGAVL
jgi:cobalt-zinc-cadmium efflux system outer membrane protein